LHQCRTGVADRKEQFRVLVAAYRAVTPVHAFALLTCGTTATGQKRLPSRFAAALVNTFTSCDVLQEPLPWEAGVSTSLRWVGQWVRAVATRRSSLAYDSAASKLEFAEFTPRQGCAQPKPTRIRT